MNPSQNPQIDIGALDTETGGLDPEKDGLISIAIVPPQSLPKVKPLSLLLEYNKTLNYDHKALEVNGFFPIEDKKTKEFFWWQTNKNGKRTCVKGLKEVEALDIALTYMEAYLKSSFIAGCNIEFDKSFLLAACKRIDKTNKIDPKDPKSYSSRLQKCLLRKTIELQTLALCAHIQNQIKLPYTTKNDNTEKTEKSPRRPSLSLNSIAKALSNANPKGKELKRNSSHHDALEDATLTLKLAQQLTEPYKLEPIKSQKNKESKENPSL